LKHYALAVWGIGLRLDPDYPAEQRFRGDLIVDAVLEYRGYGLFAPWCTFIAVAMPRVALPFIAALWAVLAFRRASFYASPFEFWTQAYNEAPTKSRNQTRYVEQLMLEIERQLKAGKDYDSPEIQAMTSKAMEIQELIVKGKL
jgi:hypothetical protein